MMTLDVTIGKLIRRGFDVEGESEDRHIHINEVFWVNQCPKSDVAICNPEHTLWTHESYRSGSSEFYEFFDMIPFYRRMKWNRTNDTDIAFLKPLIDKINELKEEDFGTERHKDRLKWFKHWSNKAVELYGDDAAIMFT